MDRPQTGIPMERPKTRWSRGSPDAREASAVTIRSSGKMERPQSRRGATKGMIQEGRESAQYQRPVSNTFFMNNRTSAASARINSAARLNTGYNTMINTQRAFDRPVTGVRPVSTRGLPRLSRYIIY